MAATLGTTTKTKIKAFLDTNVIIAYLEGKPELANLFSPEIEANVQYAINPVVIQELLLAGSPFPEGVDIAQLTKKFVMLPVDVVNSEEILKRIKSLRNKIAHLNNILMLASGKDCDYTLSYDVKMHDLSAAADVKVLNPEEFLVQMERGW